LNQAQFGPAATGGEEAYGEEAEAEEEGEEGE
jgi:hypothetical protein